MRGQGKKEKVMEVGRVQAIATLSKFMDTIPAEYVRSENKHHAITTVQGAGVAGNLPPR